MGKKKRFRGIFFFSGTAFGRPDGQNIWKNRRKNYQKNLVEKNNAQRYAGGRTQEFKTSRKHKPRVGWRQAWMTRWRPRWQHVDAARRQSRTSISWHSFWVGCSMRKVQSCLEDIYDVAFATCGKEVTSSVQILGAFGGHLHRTYVIFDRVGLLIAQPHKCSCSAAPYHANIKRRAPNTKNSQKINIFGSCFLMYHKPLRLGEKVFRHFFSEG